MKRISIRVSGKVQGVFYRANTEKTARSLGLCGFVRNETDGSVYIEAQGEEDLLNEFTAWCRKGPEKASVSDVKVSEIAAGTEMDFRILR